MEQTLPHLKFKNIEDVDIEFISNVIAISRGFYINLPSKIARGILRLDPTKKVYVKVKILTVYEVDSDAEDNS